MSTLSGRDCKERSIASTRGGVQASVAAWRTLRRVIHANPAGRAMLNGTGGPIKPRAAIRGRIHADRFVVEEIVKL